MSNLVEIKVPDIGDFSDVEVIDVLVKAGDTVAVDDALITLESDKASMDVPSPQAGTVKELKIAVGDKVSEGTLVCVLESEGAVVAAKPAATASVASGPSDLQCEMLVLGAGPGGYTAAFRAADLGMKTVLVERWSTLGGVCLNVGCIPSKALLHAARVIDESEDMGAHGIKFAKPEVDIDALRSWKEKVVGRLTGGLSGLAKQRKVQVVSGVGSFVDANHVEVVAEDGARTVVKFDKAVIAAGSEAVRLPFIPDDPRVIDSTGALALQDVPGRMLVIGGGIIGLEMATVYNSLGSKVTVVEMLDNIVAGADKDMTKPLFNRIKRRYEAILLKTRVTAVEATAKGMKVTFEGANAPAEPQLYDRILVAVGRSANGKLIGAEKAGVAVDDQGFVQVTDTQMRTTQPHIFAIGDIIGQPMLAHKAVHEGKTAAEAAAGLPSHFDARVIPSVAYTDPEVAWVGVTEEEAKAKGIKYGKGVFPWAASGRALSLAREEGVTKLIFDEETERLIGAGIVGVGAGDLIAEAAHAIEMGSNAADIGLTVHPHPTVSETVAMAAEAFEGTITDLYMPKKR
ncbi:MAG: dihydrolipoyl dehydrogenase [Gammaproteobacteria bacterium]|nr:dihydrolipoyl dehydrogenase [Gammaproteobacteria bacterium]